MGADHPGAEPTGHRARRRPWIAAGTTVLVVLLAAGMAAARGVGPDPGFGRGHGWVTLRLPGKVLFANAVALLPRGKLVIAGQVTPNHPTPTGNAQVFVARYQANGRLDRAFGRDGVFVTQLPNSQGPFNATALAADPSGRVLVAGGYGQGSMLLMRLTATGRLDRAFGPKRSGYVTLSVGNIASSMVLTRGGTITLGGSNANVLGRPMVVARFTRRGFRDRRFGRAGVVQLVFWNPTLASSSNVGSLAATPDGGVIGSGHVDYIGGRQGQAGYGEAGIFRLSASGRLVRTFGTRGHVLVGFQDARGKFKSWFPCAMTVAPRGTVTVTGDGSDLPQGQILSVRLTPTGRLDRSFGKDGRSVVPGPGSGDLTTCGGVTDSAGRFTVGVGATVAQLLADGLPNPGFSPRGRFRITSPRGVTVQALAAAGVGRLVVAGYAGPAAYLARYAIRSVSGGLG
jgi:uncharacterized delta-60 repeat protein